MIFIDTSAFYAVLDSSDTNHAKALNSWGALLTSPASLVTTNYIVVETCALLQRRLGMKAVRLFQSEVLPVIEIEWVDQRTHEIAMGSLFAAGRRKLSLVDCVSFAAMRELHVTRAFAFDAHFQEEGFVLPA